MKISFGVKTIIAAVLISFISAFFGYLSGVRSDTVPERRSVTLKKAVPQTQDASGYENNVSAKTPEYPKKYILKENSGKLSLFLSEPDGSETIYKTYDININSLPEADREKLGEGIAIESLSEALMMVEDYVE